MAVLICAREDAGPITHQLDQIEQAGLAIDHDRIFLLSDSCDTPASDRALLQQAVQQLGPGDVLAVTSLDPLGRSLPDVVATLQAIEKRQARCVCIARSGKALITVEHATLLRTLQLASNFEQRMRQLRATIAARSVAAAGRRNGRPYSLAPKIQTEVLEALHQGESISELARRYSTSRQTIMRLQAAQTKVSPSDV
jgi:putative DNA-invertase from lambdoid prophage Rac